MSTRRALADNNAGRQAVSRTQKKRAVTVVMAAVVSLVAAGCAEGSKYSQYGDDAPRSNVANRDAADLGTMPDGFSNYATKCDHGNRIYIAFHGDSPYAAIAVVQADRTCAK